MSIEFNIDISGDLLDDPAVTDVGMIMERATLAAAELIKGLWIETALRMNISDNGEYVRGLKAGPIEVLTRDVTNERATFTVAIINTAEHASIIEEGHAAFSLAKAVNWGASGGRIKQGENGPYLHIPFRHRGFATEGAAKEGGYTSSTMRAMMPRQVHQMAKQLSASIPLRFGPINSKGQFIKADRYNWGERLDRSHVKPAASYDVPGRFGHEHRGLRHVGRDREGKSLVNPTWKSSKYHGMTRAIEGQGGGRHTSYMTIRTLTPDSMGWNIPAKIGRHVAQKVAFIVDHGRFNDTIRAQIAEAIAEASGLGGGGGSP